MTKRTHPALRTCSISDYLVLQRLDASCRKPRLVDALNNGGFANWRVCPACRIDDFTHVEGCPLAPDAKGGEFLAAVLAKVGA